MDHLPAVVVYLLLTTLPLIGAYCPPGAADHVCDCQYYRYYGDPIDVYCKEKELLEVPDLSIFRGIVCSNGSTIIVFYCFILIYFF